MIRLASSMKFLSRGTDYSHPCLCRFNQARESKFRIPEVFCQTNFSTGALSGGGRILLGGNL